MIAELLVRARRATAAWCWGAALLAAAATPGSAWAQTQPATPATSAAPAAAAASPGATAPAAPAASASAPAGPAPLPAAAPAALDQRVQDLKSELIRLNRDLLILEEELLFPAGTQVAIFLSLDVGKLFELESVRVLLDDQLVASHLYTAQQVQALHRGGMQRLHLGNLKAGKHRIDAFFTGRGPQQNDMKRDMKRGASLEFDKGTEPRYIELRVRDAMQRLQPEFEIKVW